MPNRWIALECVFVAKKHQCNPYICATQAVSIFKLNSRFDDHYHHSTWQKIGWITMKSLHKSKQLSCLDMCKIPLRLDCYEIDYQHIDFNRIWNWAEISSEGLDQDPGVCCLEHYNWLGCTSTGRRHGSPIYMLLPLTANRDIDEMVSPNMYPKVVKIYSQGT